MATRLYGLLWRWHFFAGIAAVPILFVVSLTGVIYAFQPEVEAALNADVMRVTPSGPRRPIDELLRDLPDCTPTGVSVDNRPERSVPIYCKGGDLTYYVDPYRGVVLGAIEWDRSLFGVVFNLHWELLLGDPGRWAVEWATSWMLLLAASGLALWWPRGKRRTAGVLWPRRRLSGRPWLRDLHAVIGAWFAPVLCLVATTGLFWTLWAGQKYWHPLAEDEAHERAEKPPRSTVVPGATRIGVDGAIAAAGLPATALAREIYVGLPEKADDPYNLYVYDPTNQRPSAAMSIFIDAYSGDKLGQVTWDDRTAIGKIDNAGYSIHIGSLLGLPGRIVAGLAALALSFACVTGPWMWIKRRRHGRLAPPPPPARAPRGLLVGLGLIGVLLPTVGCTLIALVVLAALDHARRRIRRSPGAGDHWTTPPAPSNRTAPDPGAPEEHDDDDRT